MRDNYNIADMIADAQRDLEEIKSTQIFGSDSMNINSWYRDYNGNTNTNLIVTLTPKSDLGVMPLEIELQLSKSTIGQTAQPRVRVDGTFEWHVAFFTATNETVRLMLRWIGDGEVTVRNG